MIRLVLSSKHSLVRAGYRYILSANEDKVEILGEAENEIDTIERCMTLNAAILLLNLSQSSISPNRFIKAIVDQCPGLQVILSGDCDIPAHQFEMVSWGVFGYLSEETAARDLWTAISVVASGRYWFLRDQSEEEPVETRQIMNGPGLTCREKEVIKLLSDGLNNVQIAERLCISKRTAQFHVANLIQKFEARNRANVVTLAIRTGLIK